MFKKEGSSSVYLKKNWKVFPRIFLHHHIDRFICTKQIICAGAMVDIS